jgi:hypothetical protein
VRERRCVKHPPLAYAQGSAKEPCEKLQKGTIYHPHKSPLRAQGTRSGRLVKDFSEG